MKFWPMSVLTESPLMHPAYAIELRRMTERPPSKNSFYACGEIASQTTGCDMPNMFVIESIEAPARYMYAACPEWEEWLRLERCGVVMATDGGMHVVMEGLH